MFFFFFSFSGAQRKDFGRGRSKSLHGNAVILLLVSPGGNVSFGNHGTLFGVSERVFYAERWAKKKGEKSGRALPTLEQRVVATFFKKRR